jgi:coatomer protein complex subunit gamma
MKIDLTEDETEYKISCVKHIFDSHIVFEFICSNTIKEQALTNVTVAMEALGTSGLLEPTVLPLNVMPLTSYGSTFVVFDHEVGTQVEERFACTLKFVSKEIDPITGALEDDGYEDEYSIEDVELLATDFMRSARVQEFSQVWSESESYVENTFSKICESFFFTAWLQSVHWENCHA